jgi:hypothetical protein
MPMKIQTPVANKLVEKLLSGAAEEKYQGKQVVLMDNHIYILPDDDHQAATLIEDLEKQYPNQTPHLVTVPRPETYIL